MNPPAASDEAPARPGQWRGMIPAAYWLRSYKPQWFRSDLAAGVTLAAYVLPAAIAFLAWSARAGSVVNFVSETVLIGFKAGVALQLASTQLPKLFGLKGRRKTSVWSSIPTRRATSGGGR
jgi:MFS superfamily sulfate permease-like transporter